VGQLGAVEVGQLGAVEEGHLRSDGIFTHGGTQKIPSFKCL
jgi:hypothetical protein